MGERKTYYVKVRPTNGGMHNKNQTYPFWTTVFDETTGNSYLSIQDVPSGTEITNEAYWTLYSRNDARYEYLLGLINHVQETATTADMVKEIKEQLTNLIATSGSTDGNSELQDIRAGDNGVTYKTAGEAVRQQLHAKANKDDAMSWSQWFDLHRTGWHGGVTFPQFSVSQSPLGTKTGDNAGIVVETSTNTVKGRNDFVDKPITDLMFNGIEVNGYIDENGEPHITAVKGSPEFSRDGSNGDVYMAFLTPFYKRIYTDQVDGWDFADHQVDDLKPWDGAVRPDGTYRSFYFIAKYPGSYNDDGMIGSVSGRKLVRNISHNSQIGIFANKGSQYCGMTSTDVAWTQWMMDMKFANRNSSAIMMGAMNSYYLQYPAIIEESDVKRIIISKANAKNLLVGSYVSIGYGTSYNGTVDLDRGRSGNPHKYADDVKILKIEDYDEDNSAVYVDAPAAFSTVPVAITDSLTSKIYLSTMQWQTGACDEILGPDGSPTNCISGKEPFVLSGVELGHGGYTVISDIIMSGVYDSDADTYSQTPYIVNDNRKMTTKLTDDYAKLGFAVPNTSANWRYISKEGYDSRYPFAQFPVEIAGSSSTGLCDGVHTGALKTELRECLWFGSLSDGVASGLRCLNLCNPLGGGGWNCCSRLSSLRRGVAA